MGTDCKFVDNMYIWVQTNSGRPSNHINLLSRSLQFGPGGSTHFILQFCKTNKQTVPPSRINRLPRRDATADCLPPNSKRFRYTVSASLTIATLLSFTLHRKQTIQNLLLPIHHF